MSSRFPFAPEAARVSVQPPETQPTSPFAEIRGRLVSGVRFHVIARVAQIGSAAALVPYVLSHVSQVEYGFWSWLLAVTSYMALADLGLSQTNVQPLARALADGDDDRVNEIVSSTATFHLAIAAVIAVIAACALQAVVSGSEGAAGKIPETDSVLPLLLLAQGLSLGGLPLGSLLSALSRLDLVQKIQAATAIAQVVGSVAALELGTGLVGLACVQVGLAAATSGFRLSLALRLCPGLRFRLAPPSDLLATLSSGAPLVVLGLLGAVTLGFERVVLAFFSSFSALAQYSVATRLVLIVRELPQLLVVAILPASAALDVSGEEAAIGRLYLRAFKLTALAVLGTTAMLWISGGSLLFAWLGPGFEPAAHLIRVLAAGHLIPMIASPGLHVLAGRSRLARLSSFFLVWTLGFVGITSAWLAFSGFAGAGWSLLTVNFVGSVALIARLHSRELASVGADAWRLLGRGVAGAAVAALAGALAHAAAHATLPLEGRAGAFLEAAVGAGTLWLVLAAWAQASGFIDRVDRALLFELASFGRSRMAAAPKARSAAS